MYSPIQVLRLITNTDSQLKGKPIKDFNRICCMGRIARNDGTRKLWTINTIKVDGIVHDVVVADGRIL